MEDLGFETKVYDESRVHDVYVIDKFVYFELHRKLVADDHTWTQECKNILNRIVLADGSSSEYIMTHEDFYLFMLCHIAKHMKNAGIGIKSILDVWVYLTKYKDQLNWNKLNKSLENCHLIEFEQNIRKLSDMWFNQVKYDDRVIHELAEFISCSGWNGTKKMKQVHAAYREAGEAKSILYAKLKRYTIKIFRPLDFMSEEYKILKKIPFLLPFCWMIRVFRMRKHIGEKVLEIKETDLEGSREISKLKKRIGL